MRQFSRIPKDGTILLDNLADERVIRFLAVPRHSMPGGFGSVEGPESASDLEYILNFCSGT